MIGIERAASAPILPFVLVVAAALAWGVTNTISRVAQPPDALAMLVWASLVPPLPLLGLSLVFEGPHEIGDSLASIDLAGLGALAFVAFAAGLFGFAAWTAMLKRHDAASVTPFALLVPVFGMGSAAVFLGERPSAVELVGGAVVLLGVLLTLRPARVSAVPRAASSAPVSAAAS